MTHTDKELLLRDLSARLAYGVIVDYKEGKYDFHRWKISTLHAPAYSRSGSLINTDHDGWIGYEEYKGCGMSSGSSPLNLEKNLPFLRPMSSMTEEEVDEFTQFDVYGNGEYIMPNYETIDWLNAHHFDYRGLIEKGLAIEAPEGMYN